MLFTKDIRMAQELTIKKDILLEAPVGVVWQALTDPKIVKEYMFNCVVESDWKKDSRIAFRDEKKIQAEGIIREIIPERQLVYTLSEPERTTADFRNDLLVQISLKPQGNSTRLCVIQGDYSLLENAEERFSDAEAGWNHVIGLLRKLMRDNVAA